VCILRLVFGKGAGMLTGGQAVRPERLMGMGYTYLFPELKEALRDLVN